MRQTFVTARKLIALLVDPSISEDRLGWIKLIAYVPKDRNFMCDNNDQVIRYVYGCQNGQKISKFIKILGSLFYDLGQTFGTYLLSLIHPKDRLGYLIATVRKESFLEKLLT